jgi:hypothetical protein
MSKRITQTEAVRQAVLETLANGQRVGQEAFWDSVNWKACQKLREQDDIGRPFGIARHILRKGSALVTDLDFDRISRCYFLKDSEQD